MIAAIVLLSGTSMHDYSDAVVGTTHQRSTSRGSSFGEAAQARNLIGDVRPAKRVPSVDSQAVRNASAGPVRGSVTFTIGMGGYTNERWFLVAGLVYAWRAHREVHLPRTVLIRKHIIPEWNAPSAGWHSTRLDTVYDVAHLRDCMAPLGLRVADDPESDAVWIRPDGCPPPEGAPPGPPGARCVRQEPPRSLGPGADDLFVEFSDKMLLYFIDNDALAELTAEVDACLLPSRAIYDAAAEVLQRVLDVALSSSPSRGTAGPLVVGLHVRAEIDAAHLWNLYGDKFQHASSFKNAPSIDHETYAALTIERLGDCVTRWLNSTTSTEGAAAAAAATSQLDYRDPAVVYIASGLPLNSTLLDPLRALYPRSELMSKETIGGPRLAALGGLGPDIAAVVDSIILSHPVIRFVAGPHYSSFTTQIAVQRGRAGLPTSVHKYVRDEPACEPYSEFSTKFQFKGRHR